MHRLGLIRAGSKGHSERHPPASMTSSSPGSTSRTKWAPTMSRAGVSDARTQPPASRRPRQSGRKPLGSRTPMSWSSSQITRENAPSSVAAPWPVPPRGRGRRCADRRQKGGRPIAARRPDRCRSSTTPGSMPASAAKAAVLVRLPLWPRAKPPSPDSTVDRLGVVPRARSGGGVPGVADGHVALKRRQLVLIEDVGDQAHVLDDPQPLPVTDRHPGRLLAAVLQGEQAVVGQERHGKPGSVDAEHAAGFFRVIVGRIVDACLSGHTSHPSTARAPSRSLAAWLVPRPPSADRGAGRLPGARHPPAGAQQQRIHGAERKAQRGGDLPGPAAFKVAGDNDLALARRQRGQDRTDGDGPLGLQYGILAAVGAEGRVRRPAGPWGWPAPGSV